MKIVIQRVKYAKVITEGVVVAEIKHGLLLLVGIGKDDNIEEVEKMSKKVANLRIFEDGNGKMNLDIKQVDGHILSLPQFTLYADTRSGNRPGFELSAPPDMAKDYWNKFNELLKAQGIDLKTGIFGAHMEVELINDGPVTIIL